MRLLLLVIVCLISQIASARDLTLIYENNLGVALFKDEKRMEAFEKYVGLTAKDPNDMLIRFNLATSMHTLGEEEKALKLYKTMLKDFDNQMNSAQENEILELQKLRFAIFFNLGVAHQMMKNLDEALKSYQEALAIIPDSQEVKINIEMLLAGGSGKDKGDKKEKGENGEGDSEPEDKDQEQGEDQQKDQPKEGQNKDQKRENKPKEFDEKQMSNEDLKRIMEELKDQEQNIRAKMERKGVKSAPKDKEW